jgi:hypothetical protein
MQVDQTTSVANAFNTVNDFDAHIVAQAQEAMQTQNAVTFSSKTPITVTNAGVSAPVVPTNSLTFSFSDNAAEPVRYGDDVYILDDFTHLQSIGYEKDRNTPYFKSGTRETIKKNSQTIELKSASGIKADFDGVEGSEDFPDSFSLIIDGQVSFSYDLDS